MIASRIPPTAVPLPRASFTRRFSRAQRRRAAKASLRGMVVRPETVPLHCNTTTGEFQVQPAPRG